MKIFKKLYKNKEYSFCMADNNKPECSLIDELRELQEKEKNLSLKESSKIKKGYSLYGYRFYGIVVESDCPEQEAFKLLKEEMIKKEKFLEVEKELENIHKQIKEIKNRLGIE